MSAYYGVPILLATFALMEGAAWVAHRYLMHGVLWFLHEDHHVRRGTVFQKNDAFALMFAIPSWLFIMFGMMAGNDVRMWVGFGILTYGVAYTVVHEMVIHRRFGWAPRLNHWYFRALRRAHQAHHVRSTKHGCISFGMLLVPPRFFREMRQRARKAAEQDGEAASPGA